MDRKWWTLVAVSVGTFMLLLDITIVNVALPKIQTGLHSSFVDLQWRRDAAEKSTRPIEKIRRRPSRSASEPEVRSKAASVSA